LAFQGCRLQPPAVQAGQLADQEQAQTKAAARGAIRPRLLVEGAAQALESRRVDTGAEVTHVDGHFIPVQAHGDLDAVGAGGVGDGVDEQVQERVLQVQCIAVHA